MSQGYKTIGYRLRKHRHLMGYTIRQAAAIVGIGPTRLSQWERNLRKPSIENLLKLAVLYRVLVDELCFELRKNIAKEIGSNMIEQSDSNRNKPP